MEYNFREIEKKWQQHWKDSGVYKVSNESDKPKCYVLDMFPYPSGAGLHVGHPLGYIASDIYARFKRLKGFNVLHPMGYDAFGLPAEQYAIEHGIHPAISTEDNINNFRKQLDNIGFSFDWHREVRTSDPHYYKWTQWIFLQLFKSFYNRQTNKAESIEVLISAFEKEGNKNHPFPVASYQLPVTGNREPETGNSFTADEWNAFDEFTQQSILMEYRIAYCGYGEVNWCEALGTVLANDEVINGVSERGGYPVIKKKLRQWYLRITEYADRLLEGLRHVDFSESMKEMQSNWIGKSMGAEIEFRLTPGPSPRGEGSDSTSDTESGHYFKTADTTYWSILKQYGRDNRKNPTDTEDILWQLLRNNQLGEKVRRQHTIKGFIVDFAFLNSNLVIEIDGEYHNEEQQKKYDEARTEFLRESGFELLRFTNDEVINHTNQVIEQIKAAILQSKIVKREEIPLSGRRGVRGEAKLKVYTTRPDTIFGVDFMVLAPELDMINTIKSSAQSGEVDEYLAYVKSRSERERMAEKKITGVFTGAYAVNPFDGREIPIWISEYVLAGYGTGAIMAVPCGDERDFKFAKHFNIPITNIIGEYFNGEDPNPTKEAILQNSGFLNGMVMKDAIEVVNNKLEELGIGKKKVNYKMRDAAFSRQRYWGEPFPIVWNNGIAYPLDEKELPLVLPEVESYKPGLDGEGPLTNISEWIDQFADDAKASPAGRLEGSTMPGYAGSSWYFLRYMDPHNEKEFCDRKASDYWGQVDLYIGGTEHAVGHLLYSRMWTKCLYDLGFIGHDEPYKKLVNQGMVTGVSELAYRFHSHNHLNENIELSGEIKSNLFPYMVEKKDGKKTMLSMGKKSYSYYFSADFVTEDLKKDMSLIHIPIKFVDNGDLDISQLVNEWREEDMVFVTPKGFYLEGKWYNSDEEEIEPQNFKTISHPEKMSKRYQNVVNPNDIVLKYGADTFRMYEMFLGPVEQSKPWDTKGIEGVHRFLRKLWRLFFEDTTPLSMRREVGGEAKLWNEEKATDAELKILHKAIKKIEDDTDRFSFNTAVSAFMVCVNELAEIKCSKKEILEPLLILLAPYAPHVSEELWNVLGNTTSILDAAYPVLNASYLIESTKEYPVSINGRLRTTIHIDLNAAQEQVEQIVLANAVVKKWVEDKPVKKFIFVKGKMVNVVV